MKTIKFILPFTLGLGACAPQVPAPVINGYTNTPSTPLAYAQPKQQLKVATAPTKPYAAPPVINAIKAEPLAAAPSAQPKPSAQPVNAKVIQPSRRPATALEEIQQTLNPQAVSQPAQQQAKPQSQSSAAQAKPVVTATAAAPTPQPPVFKTHQVEPKETIYRISRTYGVSVLDIMAANDFEKPQDLKSGTMVRIPVNAQPATAVANTEPKTVPSLSTATEQATAINKPTVVAVEPSQPQQVAVTEVENDAVAATEPAAGNPPLSAKITEPADQLPVQVASRGMPAGINLQTERSLSSTEAALAESKRGKVDTAANRSSGLVWPVKGQVIRRFGQDGSGIAHTGINIAVPTGTPVLASESGKVLYADDGLKIYGKLVLLRHENGMVSAYAHNGYLLVKKGESVKKGQVIAMSGATGNVDTPQLHFELRQHASAIDPMRMLPKL